MVKLKKQALKINETVDEFEDCGDYEAAFWDEFYSKEKNEKQTVTIEELEDETNLKVEVRIPKIKTN